MRKLIGAFALVVASGSAWSQPELYGVDFGGSFYRIDTSTGAATLISHTGFDRLNAMAADANGVVYAARFRNILNPADTDKLIRIDPATGVGTLVIDFNAGPTDLRGLAFGSGGVLYALRDTSLADDLVTINLTTLAVTLVGPTGQSSLQGLAAMPDGSLFAVSGVSPNQLYSVNPATGFATLIGGSFDNDGQALEYASGTTGWVARDELREVDFLTGASTLVGSLAATTDLRGLAVLHPSPPVCYANCDGSTQPPILNVNDFVCFQQLFGAGDTRANCDGSTTPPILNVNDFICFQQLFAAGCD